MKNLLIDPYMFRLNNEYDIKDNLWFFEKIIQLCNSKKITIILYQGLLKKILDWQIQPFPIGLDSIKNPQLINEILILNHSFRHVLSNGIIGTDIDACSGSQNFTDNKKLSEDADYFELLSVILKTCYNKDFKLDPYILIGNINGKMKEGCSVEIECKCEQVKLFHKKFEWCDPCKFEDDEDKAFDHLKNAFRNGEIKFQEDPQVKRADHHNPIQKDDKNIEQYSDLSIKNRRVISLLRHFGLNKIILTDFHNDSSSTVGTIKVHHVEQGKKVDIVFGILFCETGMKSGIEMHFPSGVGVALYTYIGKWFSYEKIEQLKSKLGI